MIGIAGYGSSDEEVAPAVSPAAAPVRKAPAEASAKPAQAAPKGATTAGKVPVRKLGEIRKQVTEAKSATAVVHVARQFIDHSQDLRWTAEALYQVARRSTARTRKEWAKDKVILKMSEGLQKEASSDAPLKGRTDDVEHLMLGLEAVRRLGLQGSQEQVQPLSRIIAAVQADNWQHPVTTLSRLFWLSAPLKLEGLQRLPQELRERIHILDGTGLALLVQSMRTKTSFDAVLMQKVVVRLKGEGVHQGLSATDLVEMAEGLAELGAHDEEACRPLGMEVLRRRQELTPDESHRVHAVYQTMKLPLPQVWTKPGSAKKRDGSEIVTTTTFIPQDGHQKKRRGQNIDVERTSPPRVVRDYKMCSY